MKLRIIVLVLAILGVIGLTFYSPVELTRFIIAWNQKYGSTPLYHSDFKGELLIIWSTYSIGVAIFGFLAWREIKR
jgi:hypothetical protein